MLLKELTPTAAAGRLVEASSNGACRCLFGRPSSDVSAVQAYLDDLCRRRWNFDFAAMQPLAAGRFEWTSCTADTLSVPSRCINTPLAASADSTECDAGARVSSTDIADNNFQLSLVNCRLPLPGQCSATPIHLPVPGEKQCQFCKIKKK